MSNKTVFLFSNVDINIGLTSYLNTIGDSYEIQSSSAGKKDVKAISLSETFFNGSPNYGNGKMAVFNLYYNSSERGIEEQEPVNLRLNRGAITNFCNDNGIYCIINTIDAGYNDVKIIARTDSLSMRVMCKILGKFSPDEVTILNNDVSIGSYATYLPVINDKSTSKLSKL